MLEDHDILSDWRPGEARMGRQHRERSRERAERGKIEFRVAPLEHLYGLETVAFKRMNEFGIERRAAPGGAEAAVAGGTAGTAGDLGKFSRTEAAELIAVELAVRSKCPVADVEMGPHADRIGGDEIVDVAGLVEFDLGIAGARRKCTKYNGSAATLPPDQLRDRVNLVGRKRHDRGTAWLAGNLLLAGVNELRQARAAEDVGAREQFFHHRTDRGGAQNQRLLAPSAIEHAVRENMAALESGAELARADRHESHVEIARHRLDRRHPEAGISGLDLLLAGDKRNGVGSDPVHDLVIDLASQQPQRQSDQPGGMRQHALDG